MAEVIIFVLVSAGFVFLSRASLRASRPHGFYRLFAWEAILALILLNWQYWFRQPFASHQIISWLLLMTSLVLLVLGVHFLRTYGQPDYARQDDVPKIWIEKATRLVSVGVFRYIRHPIYSSLLFLGWGAFFKHPSWLGGVLALTTTLFLVVTAKVEEAENVRCFGSAYATYRHRTKMFVPFLF